jgi:hypothetical protein
MQEEIEHLYKYRSLTGRSAKFVERTLVYDELYFPCPKEFNDPFDCSPGPSTAVSLSDWRKYFVRLYKNKAPDISRDQRRREVRKILSDQAKIIQTTNQVMEQIANSIGVFSMSAKCDHPLMWSHYADSHRGICLRFKASSTTVFFGRAQQVRYQAKRPQLNPVRDSHDMQVEKALLTKADFWKYEEEWRIIDHDVGSGIRKFPPELLDAIIFGAHISLNDSKRIREWISQRSRRKVELFQAHIDESEFRIKIRSLEDAVKK